MIEQAQVEQMIEMFGALYDKSDETRDIVKGAREQVKALKTAIKDWCERNKFKSKDVLAVYKEYEKFRDNPALWDEDSNDDFASLLIMVIDKVREEQKSPV